MTTLLKGNWWEMTKSDRDNGVGMPEVKAQKLGNGRVEKSEIVISAPAKTVGFPERVRVGVTTYSITRAEIESEEDSYCWGKADHPRSRIVIDSRLTIKNATTTLVHELMHCAIFMSGLDVKFHNADFSEEDLVAGISNIWYGVMLDNPDLVRWLMQQGEVS